MFQKTAGISKKQDQHDTAQEILVDEHGPVDKKPRHQHRQVTDTEIAGSLILFNLPLIQIEKECRNPPHQISGLPKVATTLIFPSGNVVYASRSGRFIQIHSYHSELYG